MWVDRVDGDRFPSFLTCGTVLALLVLGANSLPAQAPDSAAVRQWEVFAQGLAGQGAPRCMGLNQAALGRARRGTATAVATRLQAIQAGTARMLSAADRGLLGQLIARDTVTNALGTGLWLNNRETAALHVLSGDALRYRGTERELAALAQLGAVLNSLYLYEETIALLQPVVAGGRGGASLLHNLAIAYAALGDGAAARPLLERAYTLAPSMGETLGAIGTLQYCAGTLEEARHTLRLAQQLRWSRHDRDLLGAIATSLGDDSPEPPGPAPGQPVSVNRVERDRNQPPAPVDPTEPPPDDPPAEEFPEPDHPWHQPLPPPARVLPLVPPYPASADEYYLDQRWVLGFASQVTRQFTALATQQLEARSRLPESDPPVGPGERHDLMIEDQLQSLASHYESRMALLLGGAGEERAGSVYDRAILPLSRESERTARGLLDGDQVRGLSLKEHPNHAAACGLWRHQGETYYRAMHRTWSLGFSRAERLPNAYLGRALRWVNLTADPDARQRRYHDVVATYYLLAAKLYASAGATASRWSAHWDVGYYSCATVAADSEAASPMAPQGERGLAVQRAIEEQGPPWGPRQEDDCVTIVIKVGPVAYRLSCKDVKLVLDGGISRISVERNFLSKESTIFVGGNVKSPRPTVGPVAGVSRTRGFTLTVDRDGNAGDIRYVDDLTWEAGVAAPLPGGSVGITQGGEIRPREEVNITQGALDLVESFSSDAAITTPPPPSAPSGNFAAFVATNR